MKRNRNITQEVLDDAWKQKQLRGEPGNIVIVDGIAWEHTDLSFAVLAKKYNAVPIEYTVFGKLYGWSKTIGNNADLLSPNGTVSIENPQHACNLNHDEEI